MRAAMFGWEALVTRECARRDEYDASDFEDRRRAIEDLEAEIIRAGHHSNGTRQAFFRLRSIRNALAHGNPPRDRRTRTILRNAGRLKEGLDEAFQRLLNGGDN